MTTLPANTGRATMAGHDARYTAQAFAELGLVVTLVDCHPMQDMARLCRGVRPSGST